MAELDDLLVRRSIDMTQSARELRTAMVWSFHATFAEQTLPLLCSRLEQARALATAGRTAEAGKKYQALLVFSQVLQLAVAMHMMAQYADTAGQPSGQIEQILEAFADQMEPILSAALSENPRHIEQALRTYPKSFSFWIEYIEQWQSRLEDGIRKVKVAKLVWDVGFLVAAMYEAAGAAAEFAATPRPPMPPMPVFVHGGGVIAAGGGAATYVELAEALRKLIAAGVLDTGVAIALSKTLAGRDVLPHPPVMPNTTAMASREPPAEPATPPATSTTPTSTTAPDRLLENALQPFKGGTLTQAGRALTKHPEVLGYTKDTLRLSLRTDVQLNAAAERALREMLGGSQKILRLPRYGVVLEFRGANGFGVRFYEQTGELIGFVNP